MTLREEIRRLANECSHNVIFKRDHKDSGLIIESTILEGVKLVLEREPSDAMSGAFSRSWTERTMPAQTWPQRLNDAYRAMIRELMKELTE